MEIKELQKFQAEMDKKYWDHEGTIDESIRHITLHLGKLLGKLAAYCEEVDHGKKTSQEIIRNEVVPDLLMHSLRLANLTGVNVEEKYDKRAEQIKKIFR